MQKIKKKRKAELTSRPQAKAHSLGLGPAQLARVSSSSPRLQAARWSRGTRRGRPVSSRPPPALSWRHASAQKPPPPSPPCPGDRPPSSSSSRTSNRRPGAPAATPGSRFSRRPPRSSTAIPPPSGALRPCRPLRSLWGELLCVSPLSPASPVLDFFWSPSTVFRPPRPTT